MYISQRVKLLFVKKIQNPVASSIMNTARPAPVRLFETTVNVMDIDRSTFYICVCGRALSVLKACNHANKSTFKFKIGI